jgi:hypothetical protein
MDGAEQVIRLLLSPGRLRQLGNQAPTLDALRAVAVGGQDDPDHDWLLQRWREREDECDDELRAAVGDGPLPAALPRCSEQIARRIQTRILREDLPALAVAIREDSDCPEASQAWLRDYDAAGGRYNDYDAAGGRYPAATLWALWEQADRVGRQRIRDEIGSDTFARTVAQAGAVLTNTVTGLNKLRGAGAAMSVVRGYALMVWTAIQFSTGGGGFGANLLLLVLTAGAALLAVTVIVPGIPAQLLGVLLVLVAITAGALRSGSSRKVGWRLVPWVVLVLSVLAVLLWYDWRQHGADAVISTLLAKTWLALAIVLLGWWVARGRPKRRTGRARSRQQ